MPGERIHAFWTDDVLVEEERRQLRTEAIQDAHDNESGNNARESETKNVTHMVSSNASPGLVRG